MVLSGMFPALTDLCFVALSRLHAAFASFIAPDMDGLLRAWNTAINEPIAVLMAVVAVVCAAVAISFGVGVRLRDRILMAVLALMSGVAAWIMATGWRLK